MKILPPNRSMELYEQGFDDQDVLGRSKPGKALSKLVDQVDDPLVIALDGRWGVGKSYFLKRWVGAHRLQNDGAANTIYFDAFAHDYHSDPLTSLVAAIGKRVSDPDGPKMKEFRSVAFRLARPLARVGLNIATLGATQALNDLGDAAVEALSSESEAALEKFWQVETGRQAAMEEFGAALTALVEESTEGEVATQRPLVLVVDELDRCRPDFALETLEVIKHFFSVPRVHFVLGVNLDALENSVVARYGAGIDASAYLRKFINLSLQLPLDLGDVYHSEPVPLVYLGHLVTEMNIPDHLAKPLAGHLKLVMRTNHVSVRDIEKIVSNLLLVHAVVHENENWLPGWLDVLVTLIVAKNIKPDLFESFASSNVTGDQLLSYLGGKPEDLEETLGDSRNENFDRLLFWEYWTWLYLSNGPSLPGLTEQVVSTVAQRFDRFGSYSENAKVPRKIVQDWIDLFSFYEEERP